MYSFLHQASLHIPCQNQVLFYRGGLQLWFPEGVRPSGTSRLYQPSRTHGTRPVHYETGVEQQTDNIRGNQIQCFSKCTTALELLSLLIARSATVRSCTAAKFSSSGCAVYCFKILTFHSTKPIILYTPPFPSALHFSLRPTTDHHLPCSFPPFLFYNWRQW